MDHTFRCGLRMSLHGPVMKRVKWQMCCLGPGTFRCRNCPSAALCFHMRCDRPAHCPAATDGQIRRKLLLLLMTRQISEWQMAM